MRLRSPFQVQLFFLLVSCGLLFVAWLIMVILEAFGLLPAFEHSVLSRFFILYLSAVFTGIVFSSFVLPFVLGFYDPSGKATEK